MALVIGTDTYISQTDATAYVTANYASAEAKRVAWVALSSDDKDSYLRRATKKIDSLVLVGVKVEVTQALEFPRAVFTDSTLYQTPFHSSLYIQQDVPEEVKFAQVEIALDLAVGPSTRVTLQREGVKSFSLGKLSEDYGSGKAQALCFEANELMKVYLAGGVQIV